MEKETRSCNELEEFLAMMRSSLKLQYVVVSDVLLWLLIVVVVVVVVVLDLL